MLKSERSPRRSQQFVLYDCEPRLWRAGGRGVVVGEFVKEVRWRSYHRTRKCLLLEGLVPSLEPMYRLRPTFKQLLHNAHEVGYSAAVREFSLTPHIPLPVGFDIPVSLCHVSLRHLLWYHRGLITLDFDVVFHRLILRTRCASYDVFSLGKYHFIPRGGSTRYVVHGVPTAQEASECLRRSLASGIMRENGRMFSSDRQLALFRAGV